MSGTKFYATGMRWGVRGESVALADTDEHPRADTSVEQLAALKPIRAKIDPESTVTAGNASGQNDGAALCVVTTPEKAAEYGLRPLARLASWAVLRTWDLAPDDPRLNPHGSGLSLGHPVGATGARMLPTLLREMDRQETRYGLETMCIGGGQGLAAVFERT